jgi:proline iminopeptidase
MDAAQREGNVEAIHQLQAIAPYPAPGKSSPIQDTYVERKWMTYHGGAMAYRKSNDAEDDLSYLSPDYIDDEIRHIGTGTHLQRLTCFPVRSLSAARRTRLTFH